LDPDNKSQIFAKWDKLGVLDRESHPKGSIIWNKMIKTRSTLSQGIIWKLGKGDKIRFWEDNWLGEGPLANRKNNTTKERVVNHFGSLVSNFITTQSQSQRLWKNLSECWNTIQPDNLECQALQEELNKCKILIFPREDEMLWG